MPAEKINTNTPDEELLTKEKPKLLRPDMYGVVLLNDDYTPMEFVVWVVMKVFYKSREESTRIMVDTHTKGKGLVDIYTFDVARSKAHQVQQFAKQNDHPLKCVLEVEQGGEE